MKLIRNIIIIILVLVLLIVAFFAVNNFLPDSNEPSEPTASTGVDDLTMQTVYTADKNAIEKIVIQNENEFYYIVKKEQGWVLNNDPAIRIKQMTCDNLANACTNVSVKETISENAENTSAFGFATPVGQVEIHFKDGTTKSILIGDKTLDEQNNYIMLSDDPNIYLRNSYGIESMIPALSSLRDLSLVSVDTENYNTVTQFYMKKQGNTAVKLIQTSVEEINSSEVQWNMTEPVYADINGINFSGKILDELSAFSAQAVIEDHAKDLTKYGFSSPYAEFSIINNDVLSHFIVGEETDSFRYLKEKDSDTVYVVLKTDLDFLNVAYMDLMSNLIHVEYVNNVDRVEVNYKNSQYKIDINGTENNLKYSLNDKEIPKDSFTKLYQGLIGLSLESLDFSDAPSIPSEGEIIYYKKDGTRVAVSFLPIDERNYRVLVDRKGNSIMNKKRFTDVIDMIKNISK